MSKLTDLEQRVEDLEARMAALLEGLRRVGAATGITVVDEPAPRALSVVK